MSGIREIEELRLRSLKALHGLESGSGYGSPHSGNFASYLSRLGVRISENELGMIYRREKAINNYLANRIEEKLGLPEGWLSEEKEFWMQVSPEDSKMLRSFSKLPDGVKMHIREIIFALDRS